MRLLAIVVGLAVLLAVPFLVWGAELERLFAGERAVAWLTDYGAWAWAAATLLLVADLAAPVPSTAVMAALGFVYGPIAGGLIGAAGSVLSGLLAYFLCRFLGRRVAARIAGESELERGERLFASAGGWIVALSRWLPLLPEVISCMAGLVRMPLPKFTAALACGAVPMAVAFAAVGHAGVDRPGLALGLSAGLPVILWPVAQWLLRRAAARSAE